MAYSRERLYARYSFSATAEIVDDSGAGASASVTNISYGGCRLLTQRQLPLGAGVTVRIRTARDRFEATAKVVHSTPGDAGLMFGHVDPPSLLTLREWIEAAAQEKSPA